MNQNANEPQQQSGELDRAYEALRQAHEAGNAEDAQQIADYIRTIEPQTKARKVPEKDLVSPELAAIGGIPTALAAGRAMEGFEQGRLREMARQARVHVPEEVIQQGRNAVINYIKAMHTGDINYVGGEDYKRAHALTEEAKIKDTMAPKGFRYDPFKQRYVSEQEFKANLQRIEQERLGQQKASASTLERLAGRSPTTARTISGFGGMLRKGVAPPFLERSAAGLYGGYSAADAINRAKQGDIPGAAISGTGALGSALTVSKNPKARALGLGLAGLSLMGNKMYESPAEEGPGFSEAVTPYYEGAKAFFGYAEGGPIQGYANRGKVEAVMTGLGALKKAFAPKPTKVVRASEALGQHENKRLGLTQTDNFGVHGGRMGGNQFPNFQNISPKHAEDRVVWMNDSERHANAMAQNSKFGNEDVIWSTYIGAPDQLKSNKTVWNDILEHHYKRNLTPEQYDLINKRIATLRPSKDKPLVFSQPFDIRDKFAVQELVDTFDKRSALASMLGEGVGVGGKKFGIAMPEYQNILRSHRDPLTEGAPTSSVGTRLFTVDPTPSRYSKEYHPDYEWTVHGQDMGVQFERPVPQQLIVPDWYARTEAKSPGKNRTHGNAWFSYMKDPQRITHDLLMNLEKEGYKQGGLAHIE